MWNFVRRFVHDRRGVTSIEAALITPLLILLLALLLQTARLNFLYAVADEAIFRGMREARINPGTDPVPLIVDRFGDLAGRLGDKQMLKVKVENAGSLEEAERESFIPGPGVDNSIVRLTIEMKVPLVEIKPFDTVEFGQREWSVYYRNELVR